jgi:hypothetical protein
MWAILIVYLKYRNMKKQDITKYIYLYAVIWQNIWCENGNKRRDTKETRIL